MPNKVGRTGISGIIKGSGILLIAVITVIIIGSCSSSPRFTKESSSTPERETERYSDPSVVDSYTGVASYYADEFNGRLTANGEVYDMHGLTAAHPSFPFNTIIRVTNLSNNKSAVIRINDRMPKRPDRIIDLSLGTAMALDMINDGIVEVRLDILEWGE